MKSFDSCSINNLPDEILLQICFKFSQVKDIVRFGMLSKRTHMISLDKKLWLYLLSCSTQLGSSYLMLRPYIDDFATSSPPQSSNTIYSGNTGTNSNNHNKSTWRSDHPSYDVNWRTEYRWRLGKLKVKHLLNTNSIWNAVNDEKNSAIYSLNADGTVRYWKLDDNQWREKACYPVEPLSFTPQFHVITTTPQLKRSRNNTSRLPTTSTTTTSTMKDMDNTPPFIYLSAFEVTSSHIYSSWKGYLLSRDIKTGQVTSCFDAHQNNLITAIHNWDENVIVTGSVDKSIKMFDLRMSCGNNRGSGNAIAQWKEEGTVLSLKRPTDTDCMVSAGRFRNLSVYDIKSRRLQQAFFCNNMATRTIVGSSRGVLYTGTSSRHFGTVDTWDIIHGARLARTRDHRLGEAVLGMSACGMRLAVSSWNGTVALLDCATRHIRTLVSAPQICFTNLSMGNKQLVASHDQGISIIELGEFQGLNDDKVDCISRNDFAVAEDDDLPTSRTIFTSAYNSSNGQTIC